MTNSFRSLMDLVANTDYYWRVTSFNTSCGQQGGTPAQFTFKMGSCYLYTSANVPIAISTTLAMSYSSTLNIPDSGTITDLDVINLQANHTYVSDLTFSLIAPDASSVELFSDLCTFNDDIDITFDSGSPNTILCPLSQKQKAQLQMNDLATFITKEMNGTWTLDFNDNFDADGGALTGF